VQPDGPYVIGGLCFGGVVALEMAHQLEQSGEVVGLVIPIDAVPRSITPRQMGTIERLYHVRSQLLQRSALRELATLARPVSEAVDRARDAAWRRISASIKTPGKALPHRLDNVERYLVRAIRRYPRSPVVRSRVLAVRADRGEEELAGALRRWRRHTEGPVDAVVVHGDQVDHLSMVRSPLVDQIIDPVSVILSELSRPTAEGDDGRVIRPTPSPVR
jgi:thioesterase domain-containing protein